MGSDELEIQKNIKLASMTYYKIGGPAEFFFQPSNVDQLLKALNWARDNHLNVHVLGLASNVLISDHGLDGLVIRLNRLNSLKVSDNQNLEIEAGHSVARLLREASQNGWGGLEFLVGIPGSIGGALIMNAGTHLGQMSDRVVAVEALVPNQKLYSYSKYQKEDLNFEYRAQTFLPHGAVVIKVILSTIPEDSITIKCKYESLLERRKNTQPVQYPSCGSVFKNPKEIGLSAWQVVDKLGLRGHQIGGAKIADQHSNFIINFDHAKAADVFALIKLVQQRAKKELELDLQTEVKLLGQF